MKDLAGVGRAGCGCSRRARPLSVLVARVHPAPGQVRLRDASLDLQTYVALSLLRGSSWSRVAASLREITEQAPGAAVPDLADRVVAAVGLDAEALARARIDAEQALVRAQRSGVDAIPFGNARYPALVAAIYDPPPILWVRGHAQALASPSVAVVGARAASASARAVAAELAGGLARAGVTVVSGLARGVDAAAHRAALESGGTTVAVLGSGADHVYPPEHRDLAHEIAGRGVLVSELPPGAPPLAEHFPRRNRLISGLALATVVVEASERSGSLITARTALEQGREVMAVPGYVLTDRNRGGHRLIKDGAKLVETVDDILEELPKLGRTHPTEGQGHQTGERDSLLAALGDREPSDVDELAGRTGLDTGTLLARLIDLELQGLVERVGGGRFLLVPRRVVT